MFKPAVEDTEVYLSGYYSACAQDVRVRAPLSESICADVCVIGGGFTGLGAALHLAETGARVVVLERAFVGWGASGRNGGQANVGMRQSQSELEKLVGKNDARSLWQLSLEARTNLHQMLARYDIDCEYRQGLLRLAHKKSYVDAGLRYLDLLRETYGYDEISPLTKSDVEALVDTKIYYGGTYDHGSGHLHPLKLACGMARAVETNGGKIYEQTEAVSLSHEGGRCAIYTARGLVRADAVVLAGDVLLKGLCSDLEARVMPINSFMAATEPLNEKLADRLISNGAAVVDSKFLVNYYRMSSDRRLLFGGGETYTYRIPKDIKKFVRKYMVDVFPQLDDVRLDYGWTGAVGITVNRLPYVRRLHNNIFVAAGYSGKGVLLAPYFGKILAQAILGDSGRLDLLGRLPSKKFPGGELGRWPLLVAGLSYYALLDRI
jgi:gamma-glutamylputrescine oxidase